MAVSITCLIPFHILILQRIVDGKTVALIITEHEYRAIKD